MQLKMMFEGKDGQTLQSLIDNGTITLGCQKMPWEALDAIGTTIKADEHFWDELLSDVHQLPDKDIHAHISALIAKCKFSHAQTQQVLKIMVL